MSLLDRIDSPQDLRRLPAASLPALAAEIRERILHTCSENGGHLAPSLGVVELTIALHTVYEAPRDRIVVRALISLARELGLTVVVEGDESAEQLALLKEWGCDLYQGYFGAPPLTHDELARFAA